MRAFNVTEVGGGWGVETIYINGQLTLSMVYSETNEEHHDSIPERRSAPSRLKRST